MIAGLLRRLGFGGRDSGATGATGTRGAKGPSAASKRGKASGRGDAGRDGELFLEAMREASPDFERYCRAADDDAVESAMRTVYAALPPTGRGGRTAVVRRFLLKKAAAEGDEDDQSEIERLSEKQLAQVARRAGIPI